MKRTHLIATLIVLLLLNACQPANPVLPTSDNIVASATPDTNPLPTGTPTANGLDGDYPAPTSPPPSDGYPQPGMDFDAYPPPVDGAVYPPIAGDEDMEPSKFFLDEVELISRPENPNYIDVFVTGSLPTPCNQLRAKVTPPDNNNRIVIQLYSLVETGKMCTQQIQPFEGPVAHLGGYPAGTYSIVVNDQPAGEFTIQ
jgi:hypothetical protein